MSRETGRPFLELLDAGTAKGDVPTEPLPEDARDDRRAEGGRVELGVMPSIRADPFASGVEVMRELFVACARMLSPAACEEGAEAP